MDKDVSRFRSSTAIVPVPTRNVSEIRSRQRPLSGMAIENSNITNYGAGIRVISPIRAPKLTDDVVRSFAVEKPEYITRHIEKRFLNSARKGYFQFGTLVNYRSKEGAIAGRLGDHQEGRIQEILNTRSGIFGRAFIEGASVSGNVMPGLKEQIVVEKVANDFCSCSSIGEFSLERGKVLRDLEADPEKKPGAYVTYHLPTLESVLEDYFSLSSDLSGFVLLGRNVEYGEKDRRLEVEHSFVYQPDRDAFAIWLGIAFVKAPTFEHEEEYRLLLVDPSGPGGLVNNTDNHVIQESSAIAASIFTSDTY